MGYGSILSRSRKASSFYPTIRIVGVTGDKIPTIQKGKAVAISEAVGSNYIAKPWAFGEYEVKVDGVTIAKVNVTQLIEYSVAAPSNILNDCSWETIRIIADQGAGANYWNVGDAKKIHIQGTIGSLGVNGDYWVYILGFNHNENIEGKLIHFGCFRTAQSYTATNSVALCDQYYNSVSSLATAFTMNTANTNVGGWASCHMRKDILGGNVADVSSAGTTTFLNCLPSDLKAQMKPCVKYTDNVGGGTNVESNISNTSDFVYLLSEFEVQGARTYTNQYEQNYQTQYDYYKIGNSKVKYKHNATGTAVWYWCRSPGVSNNQYFCAGNGAGGPGQEYSARSQGLSPAFCI